MAIKTLQNNFTTPEQSKRLLELGVPADSADCCYYVKDKCAPIEIIPPGNRNTPHTFSTYAKGYNDVFYPENPSLFEWDNMDILPCWSVGRLIKIIKICSNVPIDWTGGLNEDREILEVIDSTLYALCLGKHMDFSKLEE